MTDTPTPLFDPAAVPTSLVSDDGSLRVRRYDLTDIDLVAEAVVESLEDFCPWFPWVHDNYDRDDVAAFIGPALQDWNAGRRWEFAVDDPRTGRIIGSCGLNSYSALDRQANLGYWVRSSETGRGVCSTASRLVARFGFEHLKLARIYLFHALGNDGSRRVAEKVGFQREGVMRSRLLLNGKRKDAALLSLVGLDELR